MKGSDLWLLESVRGYFDIEFRQIAIEATMSVTSSNKSIEIVELAVDPINANNLESLMDANEGDTPYLYGKANSDEKPKKIKTTLFLGKRTGNLDRIKHVDYIEYTGNESQMGEDTYMTTCMILKKKS